MPSLVATCVTLAGAMCCSEERAKRVSDARSQRADKFRQDKERHTVMLQLQQQQQRAEEAAAAAAAAEGNEDQGDRRRPTSESAEQPSLTLIIKADVQVQARPCLYSVPSSPILCTLPHSANCSAAACV